MKNLAETITEQVTNDYNVSITSTSTEPMPNWMMKLEEAKKDLDKIRNLKETMEEKLRQAEKVKPKKSTPELTEFQKMDDLFSYMFQLAEEKAEEAKQLKLELAEKDKQIKALKEQLKK